MPRFTVFGSYAQDAGLIVGTVLHGDFTREPDLMAQVADTKGYRWVQAVDAPNAATAEEIAAHTYSEAHAGELLAYDVEHRVSVGIRVAGAKHPGAGKRTRWGRKRA